MKRWMLAGPLALSLALGLAACGGDDDDDNNNDTGDAASASVSASPDDASGSATADGSSTATNEATSGATSQSGSSATVTTTSGSQPTATSTSTAQSGGGSGSGGSADAIEDFRQLTENTDEERYHIIYTVTATSDGEEQTGTWELTQDPPRSAAVVSYEGEDEGKFIVIEDGTDSYTCFEAAGEGQCIRGSNGSLGPVSPDDAVDDLEDGESVVEVDGRRVAGRDTRCFAFTGNVGEDSGTICVDEDTGVLLLLEGEDVLIEATQYDTNIDESAFEPPFDVIG